MDSVFQFLRDFNVWTVMIRLFLAFVFGGFIGLERERHGRAAGFRTHILVCLGSAMTMLVGMFAINELALDSDPLRIGAQVVSGIGFLGVGTILIIGKKQVRGLTTAAGLWATATIGLALGIGFYEGALICFVASSFSLWRLKSLDKLFIGSKAYGIRLYFEIEGSENSPRVFSDIEGLGIHLYNVEIMPANSGRADVLGVAAMFDLPKSGTREALFADLNKIANISFAIENN